MSIVYLPYDKIDQKKWDNCVQSALHGLIYAESCYLNTMAAHWDALVLNDYEAVMPLTWKRKLGIKYLYQPAFFQQGGIFCKHPVSIELVQSFMEKASRHFKFAEITLNHGNPVIENFSVYEVQLRNNFILPLGAGYTILYEQYNSYIKQRLQRGAKFLLAYKKTLDFIAVIQLYKKLYSERLPNFSPKDYKNFEHLCSILNKKNRLVVREVYDTTNDELVAVALLLRDKTRLYNMVSCLLPKGKKLLANYFLYNAIIKEFSKEKLILDFDGSDVPGIAYFYQKFSSANQPYPFIRYNCLPAAIKLLKP